jgi:hypothetical protein
LHQPRERTRRLGVSGLLKGRLRLRVAALMLTGVSNFATGVAVLDRTRFAASILEGAEVTNAAPVTVSAEDGVY